MFSKLSVKTSVTKRLQPFIGARKGAMLTAKSLYRVGCRHEPNGAAGIGIRTQGAGRQPLRHEPSQWKEFLRVRQSRAYGSHSSESHC